MNIIAVVQARMGSTRLPGKVMKCINGTPIIELLIKRLSKSKELSKIIVATSDDERNEIMIRHLQRMKVDYVQGSENDVLERFIQASEKYKAEVIVRITGDCPFVDPDLVDEVIQSFKNEGVEYFSNIMPVTYPDGMDVEVFSYKALKRAYMETQDPYDREHVTPYIRESGLFKVGSIQFSKDVSNHRWTLDEPDDFTVIQNVFKYFKPNIYFSWLDILKLNDVKPNLFEINQKITRNEGANMGAGQKLWKRAKNIIPGGNMLLSKRPEMFLPDQWPAYFSKSKGCKVWDMDGVEYIDMSIMGVGTNILGYGDPEVDEAVQATVQAGNMSTFNCPEEVYLAEKLVDMHPWADMARFARTGGEANAISIRIARAASGKDKVAFCGYHGWHDWYLSANLGDGEGLKGHLLPGLDPNGVPNDLRGTVLPFEYNDFIGLKELVDTHNIGVIKMEVVRNMGPEDGFLQKVRKLATDRGIILIFDECTSGFRETYGGLHKKYDVNPDMAVFGKALGNGYGITAVIGKREIMEAAQNTFISSTFWTERIGPTAAVKTLEIMERESSWKTITSIGRDIRSRWQKLADKHELEISHWGLLALTGYSFNSDNAAAYKTLITQEMLKQGYLAANSVYVCTKHTEDVVSGYFDALDPIFSKIKECEEGREILPMLDGPISHTGFKRLN